MVFEALMAEGSSRLLFMPRCYCPRALAAMTKGGNFLPLQSAMLRIAPEAGDESAQGAVPKLWHSLRR